MKINNFTKNVSWMVIGRLVQMGLTLVVTLIMARYLGPAEYGSIGYTYSYLSFLVPILALGTNEIIVKELLDRKDKTNEVVGTMILFRLFVSLLSIGIIYIVSINKIYSDKLVVLTLLQSIGLIFQAFEIITYFYQSKLLASKTAIINILAYTATTIFRIIGILINRDVKWFAFAVSLDYIALAILLVITYYKDGYRFKFSFEIGKQIINKSWHYLFANILVAIYGQIDKLLLGRMINEEAVGYYSAATQLCNAWPFILTAIIDSAKPIIVELHKTDIDKYKKRIKQLYASIFYIGLAVALIFTLFSDLIIGLIYGTAYSASSMVLKITSWNTIFAYFGVSRNIWMQCEDKLKYEKVIALIGTVTSISLNLVLIKYYGINGSAIALTLTQIITNFVSICLIPQTRENGRLLVDAILLKDVF